MIKMLYCMFNGEYMVLDKYGEINFLKWIIIERIVLLSNVIYFFY